MSANKLSDAQAERLAILIEEASEVIKAAGKILRHGYDSHNPDRPELGDNQVQLAMEIGDFRAVVGKMIEASDIDNVTINRADSKRYLTFNKYTHHQP